MEGPILALFDDGQHKTRKKCGDAVGLYAGISYDIHIYCLPRSGAPLLELTYKGPDTYYLEV